MALSLSNMASERCVVAFFIVALLGLTRAPQMAFAQNQTFGSACIFNAPTGASFQVVNLIALGHVGWAFLDASAGTWYFGATENTNGSLYIAAGFDDQHWSASGTQSVMLAAFSSAAYFHQAGYYTKYRCFNVANYNVTAARAKLAEVAVSGYNVGDNNCLTKGVAILNAYGNLNMNTADFSYPILEPGILTAPNYYFDNYLTSAGWGPVNYIAYPSGTCYIFQAPIGATVVQGGGQVGWGFSDPGSNTYIFGATENRLGNASVPSGGDSQSWNSSGTEGDMYAAFKNANFSHPADYYLWYWSISVVSANVGSALAVETVLASGGYDAGFDNCLTKTVRILSAYGVPSSNLNYPANYEAPNDYSNDLTALGWGLANSIPTLPT